jgi:photosystem II stability/assembly factor-like uncharacterized protein
MDMKKKESRAKSTLRDYVYQFAASPTDWYAACASGLYRSQDKGSSWMIAYGSLSLKEPLPTLCVAAPIGSDGTPLIFAGLNGGILRSEDNGQTWQSLPMPSPAPTIASLAPSPDFAHDGILLAGTLGAGILLYKSYGSDLTMWNFGLLDHEVLCLSASPSFVKDQIIYAGVQSGLFMSGNCGRSWKDIDLPVGYEPVLSLAISTNFAKDGTLYIGTESKGLLRSTDQGGNWQRMGKEELFAPINAILLNSIHPKEGGMLVLHGDELLAASDAGDSWKRWEKDGSAERDVAAILAPQGLHADQPLLVGYINGEIRLCE